MLRLDPKSGHSAQLVIGKLTEILTDVPPDSPRALKLAEMIRGLRKIEAQQHSEPLPSPRILEDTQHAAPVAEAAAAKNK